jgi:hypothetical protein
MACQASNSGGFAARAADDAIATPAPLPASAIAAMASVSALRMITTIMPFSSAAKNRTSADMNPVTWRSSRQT